MRTITRVHGYTLVELLVVIAIIGILISMSVPAVHQVRQRMNQAKCADNLRQLAIATFNYEISRGGLPGYCSKFGEFPGGVDPADPGSFAGNVPRHVKIGGWHVSVLSKLDMQPIYERWSLDRYPLLSDSMGTREATTEGYSTIAATNIDLFQCPSASGSIALNGLNNYIANTGMHVHPFPFSYTRPDGSAGKVTFPRSMSRNNGVFNNKYAGFDPAHPTTLVPIGKRIQTEDFHDGRGNTLLFTENQQAQPWYLTRLSGNAAHLTNLAIVGGKEVSVYPVESRYLQGSVWHFEDDLQFAGAAAVRPQHKINGGDVYEEFMTSTNFTDVARPSSLHVSGVNMAMADGSVRYVVETIDYRTYQALLTPNGRSSDVPMNEHIPTRGL
jgi:prepilin-type N-terminal cleavage/methylation domain-containing protein/prepilin-type processing-associated H-X9-DG protein